MRKTTEGHGWAGSVAAAAVFIAMLLFTAVCTVAALFDGGRTELLEGFLLGLSLLLVLAMAGGIGAALVQRRREIQGGEEDEARKY